MLRPKSIWKTKAVVAKDPVLFARDMETALNELEAEGFSLAMQLERGDGWVVVGQKLDVPEFKEVEHGEEFPRPHPSVDPTKLS